jgi:hypothetical protein
MPTLQQKIAQRFVETLAQSEDANPEQIKQLRELLSDPKKLKADNFVKLFSQPAGGDVA